MGKSPGKWIKTVLFGKKSSKSKLSKDASINEKTSVTAKVPSNNFDDNSMVISSPVPPVIQAEKAHTKLVKTSSANLTTDTIEVVRNTTGPNIENGDEFIKLEQAVIMAQAALRGYLARRAFLALKGIIKLQAQIRGRLVRRQAVVTLSCMRAIVEFQAVARGQRARHSDNGLHVLQKHNSRKLEDKKRADLLGTSLQCEKLSTNAFATKLVSSTQTIIPLSLQYDPVDPNSVTNWLDRWSTSHFWDPLPQPKKIPHTKPKKKPIKSQPEETETGRVKRSARRNPGANLEGNFVNVPENEKAKITLKNVPSQQVESVQEQSHSELEKVKRSLRKISVSTFGVSEIENEKLPDFDVSEQCTNQPFEKPDSEALPIPPIEEDNVKPQDDHRPIEPQTEPESPINLEINGKEDNIYTKETQKTRRRKSFPAKQEVTESVLQNIPSLPSYMAATESAKAKLRAQAAAEDGGENGFLRRHSLPSSSGKLTLQSPRVQKPLQNNAKGWIKSNKSHLSVRDDKTTGWKR